MGFGPAGEPAIAGRTTESTQRQRTAIRNGRIFGTWPGMLPKIMPRYAPRRERMFSSGCYLTQLPVVLGFVRFFLVVSLRSLVRCSDSALWHRCFFDPPERLDLAAPSGTG